jgi:hypothetical protein
LNPEKWLDNIPPDNATIQDSNGKEHDVNEVTPLQPFRSNPAGDYWTPEGVRHTTNLGYTYPELQRWDAKYYNTKGVVDEELYRGDLTAAINNLYGVSRSLVLDPKAPTPDGVDHIDGGLRITDFGFSIRFLKYVHMIHHVATSALLTPILSLTRYAFGGQPFWIKLYLAQEEGIQTAVTDLIAEVYNFSQRPELDGATACGNCKKGQRILIKSTAYVPITPVLYRLLSTGRKLKTLTRDDVLAYLRKRAYWRVVKVRPRALCNTQGSRSLTLNRMARSCLATRWKSSTWRSLEALMTPSTSRILLYHLPLKISRQSPLFLVEQMVLLTPSSSSPRLNHQPHGKFSPVVRILDR